MTNKSSTNPLSSSLLAAYEEHKKTPSQKAAEKAAHDDQQRRSKLQRMVEAGTARDTRSDFIHLDIKRSRLAHNYLVRLQKKLFDYRKFEVRHIDFGDGSEECHLPTVKKGYQEFFELAKHTKGFLGFLVWSYKYDGDEKYYTAQVVLDDLGWVLKYGMDKEDAFKYLEGVRKIDYHASKHKIQKPNTQPLFAHSLTTPLGYVNERMKRSLARRYQKQAFLKVSKTTRKRNADKDQAAITKLLDGKATQREVVERDFFVLQYEVAKRK